MTYRRASHRPIILKPALVEFRSVAVRLGYSDRLPIEKKYKPVLAVPLRSPESEHEPKFYAAAIHSMRVGADRSAVSVPARLGKIHVNSVRRSCCGASQLRQSGRDFRVEIASPPGTQTVRPFPRWKKQQDSLLKQEAVRFHDHAEVDIHVPIDARPLC